MTPPVATALTVDAFAGESFSGLVGRLRGMLGERRDERGGDDPWQLAREALAYAAEVERLIATQKAEIDQLRSLSVTDELTGLHNRRGFLAALRRTLALAKRHGGHGIVAYLDLDNFKAVNDAHGHATGDAVLRRVADGLAGNVRSTDVVARLGGDEFAILLVEADEATGEPRARELQRAISRAAVTVRGRRITVRTSLGLEPYGPDSDAVELLRRADEAMYRDKRQRRAARGRVRCIKREAAAARPA